MVRIEGSLLFPLFNFLLPKKTLIFAPLAVGWWPSVYQFNSDKTVWLTLRRQLLQAKPAYLVFLLYLSEFLQKQNDGVR